MLVLFGLRTSHRISPRHPYTATLRNRMVLDIAMRQGRGAQTAFQLACLCSADDGALQVGIPAHLDLETAIASLDAALLLHAGIVIVHITLAVAAADAGADAHRAADRDALALAVEPGQVLQAFQVQIALDVGDHLVGTGDSSLDGSVAAAVDQQQITRIHMRIELRRTFSIFMALAGTDAGGVTDRGDLGTDDRLHPSRGAHARALAMLAFRILRRQQVDVVVGLQADIIFRIQVAAQDIDIAILAGTRGRDTDVITRQHAAAIRGAGRGLRLLAFRMAIRQADTDAWAAFFHRVLVSILGRHGCRGRRHRRHPAILGGAGRCRHGLQGLDGADHATTQRQAEAILRGPHFKLAFFIVLARFDSDAFADDVEVGAGKQVAASYHHVSASNNRQCAILGANRAARIAALQGGVTLLVHGSGFGTVTEADAATTHETAFLGAGVVQLIRGIGRRIDRDVIARKEFCCVIAQDAGTSYLYVVSGLHGDALAAQGGFDSSGRVDHVMLDGSRLVPETAIGGLACNVTHLVLEAVDQFDIIARHQSQHAASLYFRRTRAQVITCLQINIACADDLAAHFPRLALFIVSIGIAYIVVGRCDSDGIQA